MPRGSFVRALLTAIAFVPLHAADAGESLPRVRPLTDRRFEATDARREQGRYLTEHVLQCFVCHSERDWTRPGAPPVESLKGAGAVYSESEERQLVAPNITPDPETGAGNWSDDMLARAIREGIGHDGRALHPAMWYRSFALLSDDDLAAVVVYLRTLRPVHRDLPATRLSDEERQRIAAEPRPILAPVPARDMTAPAERGRYLIGLADCMGCHTSWYSPRNPGGFAGGNLIERGGRSAFSSNITTDATGIGYGPDAFLTVMRTGKGGVLHGTMPWVVFQGLTESDLRSIYAALATVQPVAHLVGNHGEPQYCAVCGQKHPLGALNVLAEPAGETVDPQLFDRLVGRYVSEVAGFSIAVWRDGDQLFAREEDGAAVRLVPQNPLEFLAPGLTAPLTFELDGDGRAIRVISRELDPITLDREN